MSINDALKKIGIIGTGIYREPMVVTQTNKDKTIIIDYIPPTPEQATAARIKAEKILFAITEQEEQCLRTIHSRYCLIKMLPIDINHVSRLTTKVDGHPTYYEYWYKLNTTSQAFLMSREIILKNGDFILQVLFNRELARPGENAADK